MRDCSWPPRTGESKPSPVAHCAERDSQHRGTALRLRLLVIDLLLHVDRGRVDDLGNLLGELFGEQAARIATGGDGDDLASLVDQEVGRHRLRLKSGPRVALRVDCVQHVELLLFDVGGDLGVGFAEDGDRGQAEILVPSCSAWK